MTVHVCDMSNYFISGIRKPETTGKVEPVSFHSWTNAVKNMSCVVRKPTICICENKDADQLRGNHEADQRLCFHYTDNTLPPLLKSEI